MAILPTNLTRVSANLRSNIATRSIQQVQQQLIRVQNQLSTGRRLNAPSDDPGDAAVAQNVRKVIEQRQSYLDNIKYAAGHLSEVDSSLDELSNLLRDAQSIASQNVGSDVTAEQRTNAAEVVKSLYTRLMNLGNRQYQGVFLFGGDRSTQPPFVDTVGGVQFVGSERVLQNQYEDGTYLPFMVDGRELFAAVASRVAGIEDVSPAIAPATRLTDLAGAAGLGVRPGTIRVSDGSLSADIDLAGADSIGDVISRINAAGLPNISASIAPTGNAIRIDSLSGTVWVEDQGGGSAALDLGIARASTAPPVSTLDGQSTQPRVTPLTTLAQLRAGAGIDTSGLTISNGLASKSIDFAGVSTVQQMLNKINGSGLGVRAEINAAGTGINLLNATQGTQLTIAENGGNTAAELGIRSMAPQTRLEDYNAGKGVRRSNQGADIRITAANGLAFDIDLSSADTTQDVIDAINGASGGAVIATIGPAGTGLRLTDNTGGTGQPLRVADLNGSGTTRDLGLDSPTLAAVIDGTNVAAAEARGIFANLGALRDALQSSDQDAITRAAEALDADLNRVTRFRGSVGNRVQEFEQRQTRLEDGEISLKSMLSQLEDADFTTTVSQFQLLQTQLEASLRSASQNVNMSLLDFIR